MLLSEADDLLAPHALDDPYSCFAVLRAEDPVHWSDAHKAWLLTRYDDVVAGFFDPRLSSDRVGPVLKRMESEGQREQRRVLELMAKWMVTTDPPAHTRLRKFANHAFQPRQIAGMETHIRELVTRLLDAFIEEGRDRLIEHFAYPLPATVIADMMGVPPEDSDRFRAWSAELALVAFGAGGQARDDRHARAAQGLEEMLAYFDGLIEHARVAPGNDMISRLLEDEEDEEFTDDEIKAMCALLLFAGHETTTNLIANGVLALLEHRDQLDRLRRRRDLIGRGVEELLRFTGPIKVLHRTVVEDFELHGRRISRGERVFLLPAAANRDPERFPEPDRLDLPRRPNHHVAFGKGVHTCIGANLARIEARAAISEIVLRLPGLRLADEELEWQPSLASRSLEELRIEYDR